MIVEVEGDPLLPPALARELMAIAREGLSNVGRHAPAKRATIRLAIRTRRRRLTIADDGRGFDRGSTRRWAPRVEQHARRAEALRDRVAVTSTSAEARESWSRSPGSSREQEVTSERNPPASPLRLLLVDDHEVVRRDSSPARPATRVSSRGRGGNRGRCHHSRPTFPSGPRHDGRPPARWNWHRSMPGHPCGDSRNTGRDADQYPDEEAVLAAILAGASGYLLKEIRGRELVSALEAVGRGDRCSTPP